MPSDHVAHDPNVPCGCWTGGDEATWTCWCGATYIRAELEDFPVWRCYDCLRIVVSSPATIIEEGPRHGFECPCCRRGCSHEEECEACGLMRVPYPVRPEERTRCESQDCVCGRANR